MSPGIVLVVLEELMKAEAGETRRWYCRHDGSG